MKKEYILLDGGRIAASSAEEFVWLLREGSWFDNDCTDGEYMQRLAPVETSTSPQKTSVAGSFPDISGGQTNFLVSYF